jgi:hypothetical protein
VDAGSWLLRVFPPEGGNLVGAWDIGSPGGSQDPADAVAIEVAGDVAGREIHLDDGLRITGLVSSPEGDPVAGVTVVAIGPVPGWSIASDADGHYQVLGLTPGTYALRVYGSDGSDFPSGVVADGVVVPEEGGSEPTGYEVLATDLTGQDITLFRGRSISGHLSGATGRPVEVSAIDASVSVLFPVDGSGNFTVRGLYPGAYHLQFSVPEALGDNFPYGKYNGAGKALVDQSADGSAVNVTAGNVTGLQAILPVLPTLSGTVRDAAGPVAGALLNACDPNRGCARAVTGADGTWRVRNVPPGSYEIQAGAAHHVVVGYASGRSNPDPFATVPVIVNHASVGGVAVVLPLGGSITGRVTGTGGVPLEGVSAFAGPTSGGIWEFGPGEVLTDASGDFTVSGLQGGSYKLAIRPPLGSPYRWGYWSTGGPTADWSQATAIPVSDQAAPALSAPVPSIRVGGQLGTTTVPVQVRWSASDPGSNIKADRLQQQTGAGAWVTVSTSVVRSVNRTLTVSATTAYRFRARATDYANNTAPDKLGPAVRALRVQQTSGSVTWKGSWTTRSSGSASGGTYRQANASGASATFTFTGRAVGWVASTGPSSGIAKVYVDGAYAGQVDLRSASPSWRRVVFARIWSTSGAHSIRVVGQGTAGRPSVSVDAFVVLR